MFETRKSTEKPAVCFSSSDQYFPMTCHTMQIFIPSSQALHSSDLDLDSWYLGGHKQNTTAYIEYASVSIVMPHPHTHTQKKKVKHSF